MIDKTLDPHRGAFTIDEFSRAYRIGRTKVYEEIAAKALKTYKVGRRRYISPPDAAAWQEQKAAA